MKKFLILTVLLGLLTACAIEGDADAQMTYNWPVEKLYAEAHNELENANYTRALRLYELLLSRFPYGRFAQQAMMDSAYTHYLDEDKALALAAIDRFEKNYPSHPDMDYMLYLRGLVQLDDHRTLLGKFSGQDWSERDSSANQASYESFAELLKRYPNSRYVEDASKKMTQIVEDLGGHQIAIARYYLERGAYLAAVKRAQNVVKDFRNTPHIEEALAMMMTAYQKMNQPQLAEDARRVLKINYPNSLYLERGWFERKTSWL